MSRLRLLVLILVLPVFACAQSQSAPDGKGIGGGNTSQAQENPAKSDGAAARPTASADSTKLEIIKAPQPIYPLQAERNEIQGQVWVQLLISEKGNVENVHVISGDPVLAKAASDAVKKWKFKPFVKDGKPMKVTTGLPFDFFFRGKVMEKGVSADMTTLTGQTESERAHSAATDSASDPTAASASHRIRLTPEMSQASLVRQVAPVYPSGAMRRGLQGDVVLQAVIGRDGRVISLIPASRPAELVGAAVGAVQQWRYRPYLHMGEPVEVDTQITIHFRLAR